MKEHKTTQSDFNLFKSEVIRLIWKIHMKDWSIFFDWRLLEDSSASCTTNTDSRTVTFTLSTKTYYDSQQAIKNSALHEVCHFIVSDIADFAYARFVTRAEVERADEIVTRRLQVILAELGL